MNTNIDNKKTKATGSNGQKLPSGITYREDRKAYCVKFTGLDGKRHEKSFKKLSEAKAYQIEVKYKASKGITFFDRKITVNALFEQYYKSFFKIRRPNTLE